MIISIMRLSSTIAVKFLVVGCLLGYVLCTPPNVIIILADDLGYGDLGWSPFNSDLTKNIQAPNLKAMAKNGMIMTNFHTASPLCSPSRASIMVGLFPWRFGVDFIYAGDLKKDSSEEMDHEQLPLVPNIAMSFRDAGYYTAHIGKWHLGLSLLWFLYVNYASFLRWTITHRDTQSSSLCLLYPRHQSIRI